MLVQPVSKLEAEKAAALNSDLGSVLVRHTSRLEKELQEAKMSVRLKEHNKHPRELEQRTEGLDQVFIKRVQGWKERSWQQRQMLRNLKHKEPP